MRGGRSIEGQIANLEKSIKYLTARIRQPEYKKQIATNTAQIVKQTELLKGLKQQKRSADAEIYALKAAANAKIASNARAAKENARVAAEEAAKQRAINNAARDARIAASEQYAVQAAANAKIASNARAAKENARVAAEEAAKSVSTTSTQPSSGIVETLQGVMGFKQNPTNAANAKIENLKKLIPQAEQLAEQLKTAAEDAKATIAPSTTIQGGKRRNRRTRRK
jgi:hypothetical protein